MKKRKTYTIKNDETLRNVGVTVKNTTKFY